MKIRTPFIYRVFGYVRNKLERYSYADSIFKSLQDKKIFFIQIGAIDGISQDPIFKYSEKWNFG